MREIKPQASPYGFGSRRYGQLGASTASPMKQLQPRTANVFDQEMNNEELFVLLALSAVHFGQSLM